MCVCEDSFDCFTQTHTHTHTQPHRTHIHTHTQQLHRLCPTKHCLLTAPFKMHRLNNMYKLSSVHVIYKVIFLGYTYSVYNRKEPKGTYIFRELYIFHSI